MKLDRSDQIAIVKCLRLTDHLTSSDCIIWPYLLDLDSGLGLAVSGESDGHLEMINSGVIYRLLEEKWKAYAKVHLLLIVLVKIKIALNWTLE